jgi:thioredoxin reductase (NADPH)
MATEEHRADVAVVGASLTGVLAAIALRKRGRTVALLEHFQDNAALESLLEIPPTPISSGVCSGREFAKLAHQHMRSVGVSEVGTAVRIALRGGYRHVTVETDRGGGVTSDAVVYSPFGVESGLPWLPQVEALIGKGVSKDAWSDAEFFKGQPVAVVGAARRAAEQAIMAAEAGAKPIILCPLQSFDPCGLGERLQAAACPILKGARVEDVRTGANGAVREVLFTDGAGKNRSEAASAIFLAQGLVCDWGIFGGLTHELTHPAVNKAGIASGLEYWRYGDQIEQAIRLADST